MLKPWKCKVSQICRCLIKPLFTHSTRTIVQGGTTWVTQILNNGIVSMVPYCAQKLLGWKNNTNPFIHLSLGRAGPFTWENHINVKALKMQGFPNIYALLNPYLKTAPKQFVQGGTPWVTQTLNNGIVSMVPYCAQKLLGWKNNKPFV